MEPQGAEQRRGGAGAESGRSLCVQIVTRFILGGPTRPIAATLARLPARGFPSALVTGWGTAHEVDVAPPPALEILRLPALVRDPSPLADARALAALRRWVALRRPAIVHTHTAKAGIIGRLATAGRRARTVHTFHGHSLDPVVSGRAALLWRLLERLFAVAATDRLVALSPRQAADLAARLGPRAARRLRVVPLAFDPRGDAAGGPLPDGFAALRRAVPRLLAFVGRGVRVKALPEFARAAARWAATAPGAAERLGIVVAGPVDPGERAAIDAVLAAAPGGPAWHFTGPVANPLPLLAAVDGLVLPSSSEGTPVAVLEALWSGLPVLASAVGGVPELLEATWTRRAAGEWTTAPGTPRGLVVRGGEDGWREALARFVADPGAIPGDADGRRRFVEDVFDPDARTDELAELYREILAP